MGGVEDVGEEETDELEGEGDEEVPGETEEVSDGQAIEEKVVA